MLALGLLGMSAAAVVKAKLGQMGRLRECTAEVA